jgi:3-hydroxybutyryl-CoA dehydrogenase
MSLSICVCGAGTMGSGIAQVAAQNNFETILFDKEEAAVEKARAVIRKNLVYLIDRNKITQKEKEAIEQRIFFSDDIKDCIADIIIEAIAENEDAKVSLFNELAKLNDEETIFATNTSSLSINSLQQRIVAPERVIGMHFFNPAYIMKLVEIVKGENTSDEIATVVHDVCIGMNKTPVICNDAPGFIVNRVARHYYLEPLKLLEGEIASFEEIDVILESSGFKMGPFKLMDLIGMDINLAVSESLYHAFKKEIRFTPSPIQIEKVSKGELGKKTGKGFYDYSNEKT